MKEGYCILYIGTERKKCESVAKAKSIATENMTRKPALRIELLSELDEFEADFWAYNYDLKEWVPS
ncbi:hypothetical protein [Kangiella sp. HZ709]|uniref:hypothetical protein n=1 Tax=Kangiella sp. HZ709 TaxID=2666328 RepID=UPI0012AEE29B|nr:hypothetical protein [Kangiella sp. HZ709]MRX28632.1 hypothetical protein [Kangiella sp. HZ709]